jgi:hypothetical protein
MGPSCNTNRVLPRWSLVQYLVAVARICQHPAIFVADFLHDGTHRDGLAHILPGRVRETACAGIAESHQSASCRLGAPDKENKKVY